MQGWVAASFTRPDKIYIYAHMCQTKEAGVQWISAQPGLCGIMWSRVMCLAHLHQRPHPPLHPSHFRISLLAALQRNRPGWSTARRSVHRKIHHQWMPNDVSVYCHLFLHSCGALLKYLVYLVLIVIIF
jgi:hypothetical protein